MYVQKKMMAKLEQERLADLANQQRLQLDALKTFTSLQQMNSSQHTLAAFLTAMMNNKNFNQQTSQLTSSPVKSTNNIGINNSLNSSSNNLSNNLSSINRSNNQLINFTNNQQSHLNNLSNNSTNNSSSNFPSSTSTNTTKSTVNKSSKSNPRKRLHSDLDAFSSSEEEPYCYAKMRQPPSLGKLSSSSRNSIDSTKLDQNNNQETPVSSDNASDALKHYDSNHSDDESNDGKQKRGRNYRKMMIEKRRRDRINNSLNELRRLVPAAFEKQGSQKLEKAEILQMTVDHLKSLHAKGKLPFFVCLNNNRDISIS